MKKNLLTYIIKKRGKKDHCNVLIKSIKKVKFTIYHQKCLPIINVRSKNIGLCVYTYIYIYWYYIDSNAKAGVVWDWRQINAHSAGVLTKNVGLNWIYTNIIWKWSQLVYEIPTVSQPAETRLYIYNYWRSVRFRKCILIQY